RVDRRRGGRRRGDVPRRRERRERESVCVGCAGEVTAETRRILLTAAKPVRELRRTGGGGPAAVGRGTATLLAGLLPRRWQGRATQPRAAHGEGRRSIDVPTAHAVGCRRPQRGSLTRGRKARGADRMQVVVLSIAASLREIVALRLSG